MQWPQPIPKPKLETDTTGVQLLNVERYVTMVLLIKAGQFNILEEQVNTELVPVEYLGTYNPLDDDFWLLVYNHPLAEQSQFFNHLQCGN